MPQTAEKHIVQPENVEQFKRWLATRGGIAVWGSLNLSYAGRTWSSPVRTEDGQPTTKPHWSATNEPIRVITDPNEIEVQVPREVKRFHIAVRRGSQGLSLKLTDGSSRRVRAAVSAAGDDAWYEFDYDTQEAVIYVPDKKVPLSEWRG